MQVDSGATVANVKTGTVGYLRIGSTVQGVNVANAGTGGTAGTYSIPVPAGLAGGSGAVLQIVIGATGAITFAGVSQGGFNYSGPQSALTFTPTGLPGITGQSLVLMLNSTPNLVTSSDQANAQFGGLPPRGVVFLNSITPGNFGFIQEFGVATVLTSGAVAPPTAMNPIAATGLVAAGAIGIASIGQAVDTATAANQLVKIYMQYVPDCQD